MKNLAVKYWGLGAVLFLLFWAVRPMLAPGFFPIHDNTQMARVYELAKALKDGYFPVRWVKDLGYGFGYPLFNFYAPLAYYVGAIFTFFGFDVLASAKIMMILGIVLSGVFMYLLAREFWGEAGGVVSGLFYVYAPYHALDIYVRGAVSEFWAMAFVPLAFWGLWKVFNDKRRRWMAVEGLGFAGIILSHNLTAMMTAPVLIGFMVWLLVSDKAKNGPEMKKALAALVLGLGLSAFYWLPALWEMGYTNVSSQLAVGNGGDYRDHFVCLNQLWDSAWGFAGSSWGCVDGMSFKIGKLHLLASAAGVLAVWKTNKGSKRRLGYFWVALLITSVLMSTKYSAMIWSWLRPLHFLQYPWRFLMLTALAASLLSGFLIWMVREFWGFKGSLASALVLLSVLLFFNIKLFQPQTILKVKSEDFIGEEIIKWTTSKISDEYMPQKFQIPNSKFQIPNDRIENGEIRLDKTQELIFEINQEQAGLVRVNLAPFPAWGGWIDNEPVELRAERRGYIVQVPKGRHEVKLRWQSTGIEKTGNLISLISLAGLTGLAGAGNKKWRLKKLI